VLPLLEPTTRVIDEEGRDVIEKSTTWNRSEAVVWERVPFTPVTVTT
jgi:hypothetical protein